MKQCFLTLLGLITLFPVSSKAGEFVLVNEIVNMTESNSGFYFWYNMSNTPSNWMSPDNYYNGQFYFRYEIVDIPTNEVCYYSLDIWGDYDGASYYTETASDISAPLSGVGSVSEYHSSPSTWYTNNGGANFSDRTTFWRWGIVLWASKNPPILLAPRNWSDDPRSWDYWDQRQKWLPMKVRVTIVAVSQGSTFSGWDNYLSDLEDPPAFQINYVNETTTQVVPSSIEYKINSGSYQPGSGQKISIVPGNTYYFRPISSPYLASTQTLVAKSRPAAPAFQIDYINESTLTAVSSDYQYANNYSMTGAVQGNNTKVALVPGTTKYFRMMATANDFASAVQSLTVPSRPGFPGPDFTIDYSSEKTSQSVGSTFEYQMSTDAGWTAGNGKKITIEPAKTYYFRAKATTSDFSSASQTLVAPDRPATPSFGIDYQNESTNTVVSSAYEYATDPAMTGAADGEGQKIPLTPGSAFFFRKKATASAFKSRIQQLSVGSRPAAPDFTIDYPNETTSQSVSNLYLYAGNADMSGAISGANNKIALAPGTVKYFRKKATASAFVSEIQSLNIPGRPSTPSFGIDYQNETTDAAVSSDYEYASVLSMAGAVSGAGQKITLVPGSEIYFRKKATVSAFKSHVQHLSVGIRPAIPAFTIDYSNEQTVQPVSADYKYSSSPSMSSPKTGSGLPVDLIPGDDKYFQKSATSDSFSSEVQELKVPERPSAPVFSIDFGKESTNESITNSVIFSGNEDFSDFQFGTDSPLSLNPGDTMYFRFQSGDDLFASEILRLEVPARPDIVNYSINFTDRTTNEVVDSMVSYSVVPGFDSAMRGSGQPLPLVPGESYYFKIIPTELSFASQVLHMKVPNVPVVHLTDENQKIGIPFEVSILFDSLVSGFSLDDLILSNAHASNLRDNFIFDVYPESKGKVSIQLPAKNGEGGYFPAEDLTVYYGGEVGIHNSMETGNFNMYPNPTNGRIQIDFPSNGKRIMLLLDTKGRVILTKVFEDQHEIVDLSALDNGMYILRIVDSQGRSYNRKLFLDL